ncbi:transglycosylase SLT domain-containing protein [Brevundimonas staleyi]|uniref:Transglycosylase SLT domain-containing protein n=1 Tax=Brevundimonas staleyi TaxID=74326 RepID=A0ABW0FZR5_9CAUL
MQDPFRSLGAPLTGDELSEQLQRGPVSRDLGFQGSRDLNRIGGTVAGYIVQNDRATFDRQRQRQFGGDGNMLSAEEATAQFGGDGLIMFDRPVNVHTAEWMHDRAQRQRFNEDVEARGGLSFLDKLGAGFLGMASDPLQIPFLLMGGEAVLLRGLGVAGKTTSAAVARGALAGAVEGVTASVALEAINYGARNAAGEDYGLGQSAANVGLGVAASATLGAVGGLVSRASRSSNRAAQRAARRSPAQSRIADQITQAAQAKGENVATALRIAEIESSLDPRAKNPASTASGVFQFLRRTWNGLGGGDPFDADLNIRRGIDLLAQNRRGLRRALGSDPQEWELYVAHQQGLGGAIEMLRDPNRPAIEALRAARVEDPEAAIRLNGGRSDMTAGEFVQKWRRTFDDGDAAAAASQPSRALDGLTENERAGSLLAAVDAINRDDVLDLGPLLARSGLDALDETTAVPSIRGRWLERDAAVTRSGGEVPVRFAVVELSDLITSHSDDLTPVADYPAALQPRDRQRPGAQAENYNLERDLNPTLLMRDKAASGGAPIVSPDGIAESGNGRLIALRRSAMTGTPAWDRYQGELARQGIDTEGFDQPVLVRMRSEPMTGVERADLAREMNQSQVEAYSPVEQARADARRLDGATLGLLDGDDAFSAQNRPFLRGFVGRVAPNDANALTDARGALSLAGKARVQAALIQKAYGDDGLTAALFETADPGIRQIGQALADAAPAWARMRAEAPTRLDLTGNLTGAVNLIREVRAEGVKVADLLDERLGQTDLFGAQALSPETAGFVRMMFRDEALTKPRGAGPLGEGLREYARAAAATPAGPDLFGDLPNGHAFLETTLRRLHALEGDGSRGLSYAGGSEPLWTGREAETAVLDLRQDGGAGRDGGGPDGGRGGGGAAERDRGGPGERAQAPLGPQPLPPELASDPEYAALLADTDALARQAGIDTPEFDAADRPETWAAAIRAAATCLADTTGIVVS